MDAQHEDLKIGGRGAHTSRQGFEWGRRVSVTQTATVGIRETGESRGWELLNFSFCSRSRAWECVRA